MTSLDATLIATGLKVGATSMVVVVLALWLPFRNRRLQARQNLSDEALLRDREKPHRR